MKMIRGEKKGFTLIELLVVIAIIALLAGILFPVFSRARDKARQAACTSNLKQIGNAFYMYLQDWDEMMPPVSRNDAGVGTVYWPQLIGTYMGLGNIVAARAAIAARRDNGTFFCKSVGPLPGGAETGMTTYVSYARNMGFKTGFAGVTLAEAVLADFATPAETMLCIEYSKSGGQLAVQEGGGGTGVATSVARPHSEGTNVLFVAGNVKWIRVADPATTFSAAKIGTRFWRKK